MNRLFFLVLFPFLLFSQPEIKKVEEKMELRPLLVNQSNNPWILMIEGKMITVPGSSIIEIDIQGDYLELFAMELLTDDNFIIYSHGFGCLDGRDGNFLLQDFQSFPVNIRNIGKNDLMIEFGKRAALLPSGDDIFLEEIPLKVDSTAWLEVSRKKEGSLSGRKIGRYKAEIINGRIYLTIE